MLRTNKNYKKLLLFTGLAALLILLAACSVPGQASSTPTPAQTLQSSATAMSKLSSVHFTLQSNVIAQGNSARTYTVTGQGDALAPDQAAVSLTSNGSPLLAVVSSGQKVYTQVKGGTWYWVEQSKIRDAEQNFFSQSLATRLGQIMGSLRNAQLTDRGQETIDGQSLDHITATLDQKTLQTISSEINGLAPAQEQSGLNQVKQATLDVWIDQATSYVHVAKIDVVTQVSTDALAHFTGQQPANTGNALPIELKAQVTFSKFNQPVTIQPPANATPLS